MIIFMFNPIYVHVPTHKESLVNFLCIWNGWVRIFSDISYSLYLSDLENVTQVLKLGWKVDFRGNINLILNLCGRVLN